MLGFSARRAPLALPALALLLLAACDQGGSSSSSGAGSAAPPPVPVNLPPPPSFKKEHAPAQYTDGSLSVYGVRNKMKENLNKQVRVKGWIIEVYQCPTCPKGTECKPCAQPHFWLADRADSPKDKAIMVTDWPEVDPETNRKLKLVEGRQYYVTGTFARMSGTGFRASDGLIVFGKIEPVPAH